MAHVPDRAVRDERGAALVMVILLVLLLTISVAAAFARVGVERRTNSDLEAQSGALMVAQSGLERYLYQTTSLPASFPVTTSFTVPGGTADVTLHRFKQSSGPGDPTIYTVVSRGRATSAQRFDSRTPTAERTVAQLLRWQTASLDIDAAFTSLSGLQKNGVSGNVNGNDGCGAQPVIPGVAVPNGTFTQSGGSTNWIDGSPDNAPQYMGTPGPTGTAHQQVDVDWAGIRNGTVLQPDFLINRQVTPNTGAFPSGTQWNNWPVVRVNGNVTNGDNFNGQGILIVTGNANLSNITWNGVVLIGGEASLSGSATRVHGAIITGLNVQLGQTVNQSSVGNGNFLVQYNSCHIASALNRLGGWQRIPNAWADNWATY